MSVRATSYFDFMLAQGESEPHAGSAKGKHEPAHKGGFAAGSTMPPPLPHRGERLSDQMRAPLHRFLVVPVV
jgi:hypothetical protein